MIMTDEQTDTQTMDPLCDGAKTDTGHTITISPPIPFSVLVEMLRVLHASHAGDA
jgi:hypothetical protein